MAVERRDWSSNRLNILEHKRETLYCTVTLETSLDVNRTTQGHISLCSFFDLNVTVVVLFSLGLEDSLIS